MVTPLLLEEPFRHTRARRLPIGEHSVIVVDDLFSAQEMREMGERFKRLPYVLADYDTAATRDVLHWKHELDEAMVHQAATIPPFSVMETVTRRLFPDCQIELGRIHFNLHLYGDLQSRHTDAAPRSGVTALLFGNDRWERQWGGEIIFYEGDEPLYAVGPLPGRLLVFSGDLPHRAGVPARSCYEPRLSLAMKFKARWPQAPARA